MSVLACPDPSSPGVNVTDPNDKIHRQPARMKQKLRELRARDGLTQDQVAKALGVHESAVSRWEGGSRVPTADDLVRLSDLFQVSVDSLLGKDLQYSASGVALLDRVLLARLEAAETTEEFDELILANKDHALWLPVPDGAVLVQVGEAMRRAAKVAEKHRGSQYVDRLFRPRM